MSVPSNDAVEDRPEASGSSGQPDAGSLDVPNNKGEEIANTANSFARYCSGIVERYQTGQLSLPESMVQISLEIA